MLRIIKFVIPAILILLLPLTVTAKRQKPLVWDMEHLKQLKKEYRCNKEAQIIIEYADKYSFAESLSVTNDKRLSFDTNNHLYNSMGPYRWPDPKTPGRYIIKDGQMNPDWKYYDSGKLNDMVTRCQRFSQAYYFTREKKYYNAFVNQLRVWFLDKETYMEPNFEYAQANPDQEIFKSNSTGMIEAYVFINLTESIYLVNSIKRIDRKTLKGLKDWMHRFAEWSDERYTAYFDNVNNNISLAFDVTLADLYLFAGEKDKAKNIIDNFSEKRLVNQIKEDGSQPAELMRTRAFYYSLYNLSHIIELCQLANYWYPNYFQVYGGRIKEAYKFLGQYVDNPDSFPYEQITSWEECKVEYNAQLERVKKLK